MLPSIINAIIITSAFSSGSACVYLASRTLFGLSREGHAPAFFQHCNRYGVPVYAVGATSIFLPLAYLVLGSGPSLVFSWLVNITTVSGLIGWAVLEISYLRMYYAFKAQGRSRDELVYKSPLQPFTAWFGLVWVVLVIIFSGMLTDVHSLYNNGLTCPRLFGLLPRKLLDQQLLECLREHPDLHCSLHLLQIFLEIKDLQHHRN